MNTFESYYIQFFHQHIMIIQEQIQKEKKPLFKLIYDIQLHNAHNSLQSTPSRHLTSVLSSAPSRQQTHRDTFWYITSLTIISPFLEFPVI